MNDLLADLLHEYRRHKSLADAAISQLGDEEFFRTPAPQVNSIAIIVKHLAGNLASRWTNFLTSDGEKPTRDRDGEFILKPEDTRRALLAAWELGWKRLFDAIESLTPADLSRSVLIRGEAHTAQQALLRGLTHAAWHVGQVLYLARLFKPDSKWLTVPPGQSSAVRGAYRKS
jgi:hypothetical protein